MSTNSNLGSIGAEAYFRLPTLPDIVAEWAGLIPLIVHLGSSRDDYHLVGETCLRGQFTAPMFPKLGQLERITDFLSSGLNFLDQTNSKGIGAATVWDVSWGSVFQCANASAREMLTRNALRKNIPVMDTEKLARTMSAKIADGNKSLNAPEKATTTPLASQPDFGIRRYQYLTIVKLSKASASEHSFAYKALSFLSSPVASVVGYLLLLSLAVLLCLSSAFGTAAIIVAGCLTKVACYLVPINRPKGYLQNTELYRNGCMLAAAHENALSWYLYVGDRGLVDWLLNKPLIMVDQATPQILAGYFKMAHYVQLLIMTYVAAQKGWDGVCLLCLMQVTQLTNWALSWDSPSKDWLNKEQVTCTATVVKVSGRTPMLGAVQLLNDRDLNPNMSHRNPSWMDGIISPSKRRDAWTDALLKVAGGKAVKDAVENNPSLSDHDNTWVGRNTRLAVEAADVILRALDNGQATKFSA